VGDVVLTCFISMLY